VSEANAERNTLGRAFFVVVTALMFFGFLVVYSATSVATRGPFTDTHFVERQLIWGLVALAGMSAAAAVPLGWLRRAAPYLYALSVALLVAVLFFGTRYNGAMRWFRIGEAGFHVQASEIAKVGMIVFLAAFLARPVHEVKRFFRTFVPAIAAAGLVCGLILKEPDFGCAFFIAGWSVVVMLVAGVRWWYLAGSLAAAAPGAVYAVLSSPMHLRRVTAFQDPWADPLGSGHQLVQSLIALGSGGLRGVGLGMSQQRLSFLPEAPTDFIFSIIGEQFGFLGAMAVLALFGLLLYLGARIVLDAEDRFAFLLGFGALSMIVFQVIINVAVVTGSVPTKGMALPFISFGGSGLVWAGVSAGLICNVSGQRRAVSRERPAVSDERSPVAAAGAWGRESEAMG
jgi:cell division protein FtsW